MVTAVMLGACSRLLCFTTVDPFLRWWLFQHVSTAGKKFNQMIHESIHHQLVSTPTPTRSHHITTHHFALRCRSPDASSSCWSWRPASPVLLFPATVAPSSPELVPAEARDPAVEAMIQESRWWCGWDAMGRRVDVKVDGGFVCLSWLRRMI